MLKTDRIGEQEEDHFIKGVKDSLPTLFGYISIGIAFGVVGIASNLNTLEITLLSILVYAGAAQFIFVDYILPERLLQLLF